MSKYTNFDQLSYDLSCFKSYDIRGKVPQQFNADLAYMIGRAYTQLLNPGSVIVGQDVRIESPQIAGAVMDGIIDSGADVIDIGVCGTEEVYFHCFDREDRGVGGGIMITASHNPMGYNGLKMVGRGSTPIFSERGLDEIKHIIEYNKFKNDVVGSKGKIDVDRDKTSYISHLLGYVDLSKLKPLKIVVNPGNGPAGAIIKLLESSFKPGGLPFEFVYIHEKPDGNFPNGIPNPIIKENQRSTSEAVVKHKADFGIAWDGDFDRCFFFDEYGKFIEGYYLVGLLADVLLASKKNETVIHDPRLIWNTIDIAKIHGAGHIQSKTGHSFMKDVMRSNNAIYGGEMSAHHYFRDFAYCDSGMIPWLLVAEMLSIKQQSLSSVIAERQKLHPCSGEINFRVKDAKAIIQKIVSYYEGHNPKLNKTDGVSLEFDNWRFNLRMSNTEPLLRLNIETRGDKDLLLAQTAKLKSLITKH